VRDAGRPQSFQAGLGLPQVVGGGADCAGERDRTAIVEEALWIGGAQWAGKTTVARILSERHGLGHLACG
jgi:hypothetical protein